MATLIEESEVTEPPVARRHRDFRLVRTQRVLQIVLGLFWLLDAGLQFQPYMFGSGFTTTYLLNNAHNQPDIVRWIITNVGNFVGPHVAVWNTFFALIQVAIGLGLLFRRTVRPALVRVVLLGLRRLVLRGRPRPALHRIGVRPHRRTGFGVPLRADRPDGLAAVSSHRGGRGDGTERRHRVLGRGTGHRWSDNAPAGLVRLLVAGGDPVPAAEQPNPDIGLERDRWHVAGRAERVLPLSQQLWQPFRQWRRLDHVVAGHRLADRRVRATRVPPSDSVPCRRWPVGDLLLGQRPGSWRHLHRLGHRPELWAPCRAPGAWPWCRPCCRIRRPGSPRSRPRSFAIPCWCWEAWWPWWPPVPQRRLPGRCPGVDGHGHGRHDRHVRVATSGSSGQSLQRRPPVRGGTTARRGRAWT